MPILYDNDALTEAGFLIPHSRAILDVCDAQDCIIMFRPPGKHTAALVAEGYASKGYFNKAKSCNWGPMAGFVLSFPRFSKAGLSQNGLRRQTTAVNEAIEHGTTVQPLVISERRRKSLQYNEYIQTEVPAQTVYKQVASQLGEKQFITVSATMKDCVEIAETTIYPNEPAPANPVGRDDDTARFIATAKQYRFFLVPCKPQDADVNATADQKMYSVHYKVPGGNRVYPVNVLVDAQWNPAVNVFNGPVTATYNGSMIPWWKKATTGDYDLFAAWQRQTPNMNVHLNYSPDATMGIISGFLAGVVTDLNGAINNNRFGQDQNNTTNFSYAAGNMVHHGAEVANPHPMGMEDCIAFLPANFTQGPNNSRVVYYPGPTEFNNLFRAALAAQPPFFVDIARGWVPVLQGLPANNDIRDDIPNYEIVA